MTNPSTLSSEDRYDYFLTLVAEEREVWILVNDDEEFLKLFSDELNLEALLVWPSEPLAQDYAAGAGEALKPKSIALPLFLMKWIAGLEQDRLWVNVYPDAGDDAWLMEPQSLKGDLQAEIEMSKGGY